MWMLNVLLAQMDGGQDENCHEAQALARCLHLRRFPDFDATGADRHPDSQWLATAAIATFVVHLLGQWDWIIAVGRRFFARWERSRLNFILDVSLLVAMTTVFVSGYAISRSVFPFVGLPVSRDFVWRRLHDLSANATLIIVAAHTAMHWRWIIHAVQHYILKPLTKGVRTILRRTPRQLSSVEEAKS